MEKKLHSLRNLKQARKAAGLTQEQLAGRLDVNLKTVRNWEQGLSVPEFETMITICDMLSCDLDYLAGRIDARTHDTKAISDLTGLSPAAAERLQAFKAEPAEFVGALSHLIEQDAFMELITKYSAFRCLMKIYRHIKAKQLDCDTDMHFNYENNTITFPLPGAVEYARQSTTEQMAIICRGE